MPVSHDLTVQVMIGLNLNKRLFRSFTEFYNWVKAEVQKWEKADLEKSLVVEIQQRQYMNLLKGLDAYSLLEDAEQARIQRSQLVDSKYTNLRFIEYDSNLSLFLINQGKNPEFKSFCNLFFNPSTNWSSNNLARYDTSMYLSAHHFSLFDEYPTLKKYNKFLEQADRVSGVVANIEESLSNWKENSEKSIETFENDSKKLITDKMLEMQELIKSENEEFDQNRADFDLRMGKVEKLYKEKLRFSEPVENWKIQQEIYEKRGLSYIKASVFNAIIIVVSIFIIILCMPTIIYDDQTSQLIVYGTKNLTSIIRWFILSAIAIGTEIYLLRLFVKFAMSSLHLARDAEERKTLTYLYLSLLEENSVDEKQASIVYSALFSRSESGLLKGDSGPSIISPLSAVKDMFGGT